MKFIYHADRDRNLNKLSYRLWDRATRKPAKDCWNWREHDNLGWNDLQMYFKVMKSGTHRKLVYDFLLVVYSNFCRITHRFLRNLMWNSLITFNWNMAKAPTGQPCMVDKQNVYVVYSGVTRVSCARGQKQQSATPSSPPPPPPPNFPHLPLPARSSHGLSSLSMGADMRKIFSGFFSLRNRIM